jgi:hypothetical protein
MSTSSALYIIAVLKCVGKATISISITVSVRISSDSSSSSNNNRICFRKHSLNHYLFS